MAGKTKIIIRYSNLALTFFFCFFFRYLPPFADLTPLSMQVLGVFIGVIYAWITISTGWPSVMGIVAFGLTDYMPMNRLLEISFGSQTMVMILCLLVIAAYVQQAGLTDVILDAMLSRPEARKRPFLLLFYFLYAGFIGSILSNCVAVLIIFIELFREMMRKTGIAPYSRAVPCFFVGMAYAFILGDIAVPFKSTSILSIGAYEAITGQTMNLAKFTIFMFPLCSAAIAVYVLLCKYVFRIDLSALAKYHHPAREEKLPLRKKTALIGVLVAMCLLLAPGIVPPDWLVGRFLSVIGLGGLSLLLITALLVIRVQGEPLMDFGKLAQYFPWNVYFIIAFLLPLATALSSDPVGIKTLLSTAAASVLTNIPGILVIFAMVLLSALITNFANNVVICVIFVSIIGTIGANMPYNLAVMSCLVIISANISCFFPAANPMNAILFAQTDIVTFRQEATHGLLTCVTQSIFIAVFGYLWGLLVF